MADVIDDENIANIISTLLLEREHADLITNCYQNPRSIHPLHLYFHNYFYRPEIYDPIFEVNFPDEAKERFAEFVDDYLQQPLKDMILNSAWSDVLDFCTKLLLQHNCYIEDSCKKHMLLIMKLRIIAKKQISKYSIIKDFKVLTKYESDFPLLLLYYLIFIDDLDLAEEFFMDFPLGVVKYFLNTVTIIVQFYLNTFHEYSHGLLSEREFARLELLITFGVRNLELVEDGRYDFYYDINYSHEFDFPGAVRLNINSRIKMRIMQIFILFKAQKAILLQKIMATNQEPYLTKQQYEAALSNFFRDEIIRMRFAPVIERRWNWYKKVFKIEDDTPVMPRKLQDICRLSFRDFLAMRGQLPSGLDSICRSHILRKYLKLEDLVEYPID